MSENINFEKARKYSDIIEVILILIFSIAVILKFFSIAAHAELIIFSLGALSCLYFLNSFFIKNINKDKFTTVFNSVSFWGLSIAVLGIIFTINHYPMHKEMIIAGIVTILISLILSIWVFMKKFCIYKLLRLLIVGITACLLYF